MIGVSSNPPLKLNVTTSGSNSTGQKCYFKFDEITNSSIDYSSRELFGSEFPEPNVYKEFKLTFSLNIPDRLEFPGTYVSRDVNIFLDWINVTQLSAFP